MSDNQAPKQRSNMAPDIDAFGIKNSCHFSSRQNLSMKYHLNALLGQAIMQGKFRVAEVIMDRLRNYLR